MIDDRQRQQALDEIRENIARNGRHIYRVVGETCPRFAYTIGFSESGGVELILAGAIFYMRDDGAQIIRNLFGNDNASHGSTRSLNIRRSLLTLRGFAETELPKPAAGKKTSGNSLPTQDPASRKRKCVWLPLERWVKKGQAAEAQRNPESSSM